MARASSRKAKAKRKSKSKLGDQLAPPPVTSKAHGNAMARMRTAMKGAKSDIKARWDNAKKKRNESGLEYSMRAATSTTSQQRKSLRKRSPKNGVL